MFCGFIASSLKIFRKQNNQQKYIKCAEDATSKWKVRTY